MATSKRRAPWKPTRAEITAARGGTIPDVIAPGLRVLFCGINPSLYSAAIGHHFGRPGNRFWPALYAAGITDRLLSPFEDRELLASGYGITNLIARATATAEELTKDELASGARILERKVRRLRPGYVAFAGITAYRTAFVRSQATVGLQREQIADSGIWVLPNPSGLNAHFQLLDLVQLYHQLRCALVNCPGVTVSESTSQSPRE
jgi:TDG/mug DNA glycosylase family protein